MRYKLLTLSAGLLLAGVLFNSCKQGTNLTDPMPMKTSAPSTPAHPALTYVAQVQSGHGSGTTWLQTVAVTDTDGTHATNVYVATSSTVGISVPCWSPTGGSIAFVEGSGGTQYIKAMDVSVNSSGVPVGSNVRTICSTTESIQEIAWCSSSGTGRLAFAAYHSTGTGTVYELYTVSQSGGTPTMIKSDSNGALAWPTWSPDDSKLAVLCNTASTRRLRVFNPSSGAILEDDTLSGFYSAGAGCEWARAGNTIAFGGKASSTAAWEINYLDYGSGTGAYTQHAAGTWPSWSPNDATLILTSTYPIMKINAFGSTETTVATSGPMSPVRWKR